MNRFQTSTARPNFSVAEGPEIESEGDLCPTIDPTSLPGPGRGRTYGPVVGKGLRHVSLIPPTTGSAGTYVCGVDADSDELWKEDYVWLRIRPWGQGNLPVTPQATPAERFRKLAATWKTAVRFLSDTDEMCSHPAYQEIIGMGAAALPFIFLELEREPDNWFWALKAITGEDPVPEEHQGNVELMAKDWLLWAQSYRAALGS